MSEYPSYLIHYGIQGQKWGVRRFQNDDGTYTDEGLRRRRKIEQYEPPYSKEEILKNYGKVLYKKLSTDPIHKWRMETGIELIHKEPILEELNRIWKNWNLMSDDQKEISDKQSIKFFGVDNRTHYAKLKREY